MNTVTSAVAKVVWILEETGKEQPITTGLVVKGTLQATAVKMNSHAPILPLKGYLSRGPLKGGDINFEGVPAPYSPFPLEVNIALLPQRLASSGRRR